ncbi:MAG: cation transporter [Rubellimicrobium sp.]|nr:cation transporter [Rubellimicrobium sp.]
MSGTLRIAIGSLLVGGVVLVLKLLAWWMTGSVALLSDALESTVNLATALATLVALVVAGRPADAGHPFGHTKAEFFSAVLEGVMIIIAALFILRAAWLGYQAGSVPEAPVEGVLVNGLATVLNGVWAWILIRHGRASRSPALIADGRHLWTDVVSSVGVALGVLLAIATGWWVLDPLLAALVALNILWSGTMVMRESLSGLMDEAAPEEALALIRDTIARHASGAIEAHDLKTRQAGQATFVEFHLVVPGRMTVFDAHEICDRLEAAIARALPGARVVIHIEPEHKSKHAGIVVVDWDGRTG